MLRSLIYDVMKVEGLGTLWQPGEDPPQSVKDWWGEEEIDLEIFRMYETQNLDKPMMDKVRGKHATRRTQLLSGRKRLSIATGSDWAIRWTSFT